MTYYSKDVIEANKIIFPAERSSHVARRLLKSMSELHYIDRPKHPNYGISFLCMCPDDQQQPTHGSDAVGNTVYWCKRCGLYLGLRDMDAYYQSEAYAIEKASRQQTAGGT